MVKIILLGNYKADKQESMERFAQMLKNGFIQNGVDSIIWYPPFLFGRLTDSHNSGLGKWLGYIDKWILFPFTILWKRLFLLFNKNIRFHICDHSNAPYISYLPNKRTVITCHDVLAIRGALGYKDSYCTSTKTGIILQKWILKSLCKADNIATVSQFTLNQLEEIQVKTKSIKNWKVIPNAFNADFYPMNKIEVKRILQKNKITIFKPFILHVGSSLQRKNRKLLVDMLHCLNITWDGIVCFAGQEIELELQKHIDSLGLQNKVISILKPSHEVLVALYSSCESFIFPSFSEGFGWPIIEAQACGAPVIASSYDPLPEVSGNAAIHNDPLNPNEFADSLLSLQNELTRNELIKAGYENCKRFELKRIIQEYLSIHSL